MYKHYPNNIYIYNLSIHFNNTINNFNHYRICLQFTHSTPYNKVTNFKIIKNRIV